jgi:hypothetical protein
MNPYRLASGTKMNTDSLIANKKRFVKKKEEDEEEDE